MGLVIVNGIFLTIIFSTHLLMNRIDSFVRIGLIPCNYTELSWTSVCILQ